MAISSPQLWSHCVQNRTEQKLPSLVAREQTTDNELGKQSPTLHLRVYETKSSLGNGLNDGLPTDPSSGIYSPILTTP